MTDQTTDLMFGNAPITDVKIDAEAMRAKLRHSPPRREFYAYFAIIFLAALPLATLTWALSAGRQMALPKRGPVARAWSQARVITPMIFSA
jgi:hypothetical protein